MPCLSTRTPAWQALISLLLLLAFIVFGTIHFNRAFDDSGGDLASSYIGCRLLLTHQADGHLYAFDPHDFAAIGPDDPWQQAADDGDYYGWLHPYVQTPLWAWSLRPFCGPLQFPAFNRLFTALALLCFALLIALVAVFWAPRLCSPLALALTLLALWWSVPFQYAMYLTQTHVVYLLLTVAALILAERQRGASAGVLLALAAAVKLTPAVFCIYWLVTRRYRAAATFVLASIALLAAARLSAGPALFADYLSTLHRISRTLLVAENNQSLAAVLLAHRFPSRELYRILTFPLPPSLSLLGNALLLSAPVAGGLLDRNRASASSAKQTPPLGALLTLVAATLVTPIAWTHYFIVLLPALMVLADQALAAPSHRGRFVLLFAAAATLVLNLPPLAPVVIGNLDRSPHALIHAQFFAGLLCLGALLLPALFRSTGTAPPLYPKR